MGETINLTASDGHSFSAYQAGPADASKALVVVQEIFGVNHHMRNVSDRFASHGYRVICPALFDRTERNVELGYTADDVARGRTLRSQVPDAGMMLDIEASGRALAGASLGIVGYCWGGTVAWWGATRTNGMFKAANGWYGGGIADTRNETPACPVELHFGEKDAGIPLSDVELIREAHPEIGIFIYPGALHGFGCDERASFSAPDAALAWERTLAFFTKHL